LVDLYSLEGYGEEFEDEDDHNAETQDYLQKMGATTRLVTNDAKNGELMGFYSATVTNEHPFGVSYGEYEYRYVFLDYIYCLPHYRRNGFGVAVVAQLEALAREEGVEHILSAYCDSNVSSLQWHAKMGFHPYVRVFRKAL
jgi:GNAT superfamily N-acetyltransferase